MGAVRNGGVPAVMTLYLSMSLSCVVTLHRGWSYLSQVNWDRLVFFHRSKLQKKEVRDVQTCM